MTPTPAASEQPSEKDLMRIYDDAYQSAPPAGSKEGAARGAPSKHGAGCMAVWNAALSRLREEVIEECALICERVMRDGAVAPNIFTAGAMGAHQCAEAIRSLHAQPQDEQKN